MRVIVAGGGAAGYFAAIACARSNPGARVTICEAAARPLAKVRISGGGRCNLTNACTDPALLVRSYPRGGRELRGPLHRWGPRETMDWFAAEGVALEARADGKVFPAQGDSSEVIGCLERAAAKAGVAVRTRCGVRAARPGFSVELAMGETLECDRLLVATGGGREGAGLGIAAQFGHAIEPPVPSLFTFRVADPRIEGLAGIAVEAGVAAAGLSEFGPLLITHEGFSGPAVLRLSAWGARPLHDRGYRFELAVDWAPGRKAGDVEAVLAQARTGHPRRRISGWNPFDLPQRLWERIAAAAGVAPEAVWASASNTACRALAAQVGRSVFAVDGRAVNKEEFVTCGGVRLSEIDFRTMESRRCPGLHFAGEVLDIDGLTGGFNLQAAWTTGWIAGCAMGGEGAGA